MTNQKDLKGKAPLKEREAKSIPPFFNPRLPPKIYSIIKCVWETQDLNRRKYFRRSMTNLVRYLSEKEQEFMTIKYYIKLVGG